MSFDTIKTITNQFNNSNCTEKDIEKSISELDKLEKNVECLSDYIIIKYDKCLLYDLSNSTTRDQFFYEMDVLNDAILSGILDDSKVSEEFFYNVGNLNFKAHKYDIAKIMLYKSIKRETNKDNISKATMRFHKRSLLAFCLEYSAASCSDYMFLIEYLVGYKIGEGVIREDIIKNTIQLHDYSINDNCFINNTVDSLYNKTKVKNRDCLLFWLKQNLSNNIITENQYNNFVREIAHILAHCFSEYYKIAGESKKTNSTEYFYLLRASELLMESLGSEYVTCLATLKIEQNEYYSAIEILNLAKKDFENKIWEKQLDKQKASIEYITIIKQIAQIDFYIWYFSVFARKEDGVESKKNFKKYCESNQDNTASTYFEILHMKETLIELFSEYKKGLVKQESVNQFNEFFESIRGKSPHHTLPDVLVKEWDFLKFSYSVFLLCKEIYDSSETNKAYNHFCLFKALYDRYNIEYKIAYKNQITPNRSLETSKTFYWVKLFNGSFLYIGKREKLKSTLDVLNIGFSQLKLINYDTGIKKALNIYQIKDISNITIVPDDDNYRTILSFVSEIIKADSTKSNKDKHNLYIDTSFLNETNTKQFEIHIDKIKGGHSCIYMIRNSKVAYSQCIMFAFLEFHLSILQKPLESYVISPISDDSTYYNQSFQSKRLIYSIDSQIGFLPEWNSNFGSCYSNIRNIGVNGKKLKINYLRTINAYNRIKYLFLFEENYHTKATSIYAFDIAKHLKLEDEFIISDGINPYDNRKDLFQSIEILYNKSKGLQPHMRGGHNNCTENCASAFVEINLSEESNQDLHREYKVLREYLYSYLGIMVDKSTFVLLQCHESTSQETRDYVLVSFTEAIDWLEQQPYCCGLRLLSEYIDNVSSADNISKIETIADLEEQIKPCESNQKFFFISYRSNHGMVRLCEPVYRDVIFIQKNYSKKFNCVIDVANSKIEFAKDIEQRINSSNCIGAFIYLSPYYIDSDICLKEIALINKRKKTDEKFIVLPIWLKSACFDTEYSDVSDAKTFVKKMAEKLRNENSYSENTKFDLFAEALRIDNKNTSEIAIETWRPYGEHISKNRNFKCELNEHFSTEG